MRIDERLKQDHDKHRQLADQILETTGESEERKRLWAEFQADVMAHADAEEQTFYAELMADPRSQGESRHSVAEHKELDDEIEALDDLDMSSPGWLLKFRHLRDRLLHHMEEEEEDVFPLARKVLGEATSLGMTERFEARKSQEKGDSAG